MPRALATIGSGQMKPLLKLALPTFLEYGDRHGYDVVVGSGKEAGSRPTSWSKVAMLTQLLGQHDEVLWVDSDAVIVETSQDLSELVPPSAFQALVEVRMHAGKWRAPNMGVWLLRSTDRSKEYLRALWESYEFIHHPWWENAAALTLLGYELEPRVWPVHATEWLAETHFLSAEWNVIPPHTRLEGARIVHYAGRSYHERIDLMRAARGLPREPALMRSGRRLLESARYRVQRKPK